MRVDPAAGASSLPGRDGIVRAGAGHSQPQTHVDEQPAGSVPGGGDEFVPPFFALYARRGVGVVPKLGDTASDQRLDEDRMLVHADLL